MATFPTCYGIMAPDNAKDEMILSFHGPAGDGDTGGENCIKVWHKEKCQKTVAWSAVLAAVPDIIDPRYFTVYFTDGTSPWTYYCANGESRSALCLLLNECQNQQQPNLAANDERFCSTWVEKKGKMKWARRWIALAGCRLLCFRDEAVAPQGRKPPSTVPLNVIPMSAENGTSRFKTSVSVSGTTIVIKNFREYQFRFPTKDEANMWMQALSMAAQRQQHISETERASSAGDRPGGGRGHTTPSAPPPSASSSKLHNREATATYGIPPPANIPGAPPNMPPPPKEARRSDLARRAGGKAAIEKVPNAQRLYAWGSNKKGQLALKPSAGAEVGHATLIETLRNRNTPVAVSAGYNHMAAITCNGMLFVWGDGKHGQLGLGPRIKQSSRPYLVGSLKNTKVRLVACGRMHTLIVSVFRECARC